jgi:hypothetical protein
MVMSSLSARITVGLEELEGMPLKPLTRVRFSAAAVDRAERELDRARLEQADAIVAAHGAGHSFAEIGLALGLTRQRIHALVVWRKAQDRKGK